MIVNPVLTNPAGSVSYPLAGAGALVARWGRRMNFQRVLLVLVVLLAAGLAGSFYMNWKTLGQLRTVKAFVEGSVFADAVAACERAQSTTPFKWNGGKQIAVIGLNSVKLNKDTIIAELHAGRRQRLLRL